MNNAEKIELAKSKIIQAMMSLSSEFGMDAYISVLVAEAALYEYRKAIDLQLAQYEVEKEAESK